MRSDPKLGNWESGRKPVLWGLWMEHLRGVKNPPKGQRPGRAARGFPAGGVSRAPSSLTQGTLGTEAEGVEMVLLRAVAGQHLLSVLGPVGGGGGHEADGGTAAATAATAAAEAALGGQWAGDAGSADFAHQHRAPSGASAQQVPTAHDPGPADAGAAEAAGPDVAAAAASGDDDPATAEAGAAVQGLGPAHQAAPGATHRCRRKKPSERLPHPPRSERTDRSGLGPRGSYYLRSQYPLFRPFAWVTQRL